MIGPELNDSIQQTFDTCAVHLKRMAFAKSKVGSFIPLDSDSAFSWVQLRKIRNDIAHEYPASLIERIEGINHLFDKMEVLRQIIERCQNILNKHK